MGDYIDREELVGWLTRPSGFRASCEDCGEDGEEIDCLDCILEDAIKEAPAVDVQEIKHGKWKLCYEDWRRQIAGDECSACGFQHYGTCISHYHYCPNCGAKMDGGNNNG